MNSPSNHQEVHSEEESSSRLKAEEDNPTPHLDKATNPDSNIQDSLEAIRINIISLTIEWVFDEKE